MEILTIRNVDRKVVYMVYGKNYICNIDNFLFSIHNIIIFFVYTTCRKLFYMSYRQKPFVHMRYIQFVYILFRKIFHMQYRQ